MQQIIVQAQPGGYLLILKPSEYDTMVSIGAFKGIKVSYDIDPSSGNYQMKLNSADWSVFQVNLGATEGGAYTLKLTPAQFEEFKTIGFFNNLKIQAAVQPNGDYVINLNPEEYKIFQENQKKAKSAPQAAVPEDSISVTQDSSGKFVLQIPEPVWKIIIQNKGFEGIKPTPDPKPNPAGSRTVTLTPAQWKTFQDNQKKPPTPVPVEPEPGKKPSDKPADEISVTKDPSGKFVMQIPAHLWTIILQNKGLEGIKPIPTPKPNPDGSRTVTLTPAQWQTFQDNQKKPPIAIPDKPEPGKEPTDSISVINDPSGKFVLRIPANLWTIIIQNKGFEGIKPTPNPKPNPDGSRTVTLPPAQWKIFQDNRKKPPVPTPAEAPSGDTIAATKDKSGNFVLQIPEPVWKIVNQNKGFEGIK